MCGIAGYLDTRAATPELELRATAAAMLRKLRQRGPDDEGTWTDEKGGVALGYTRLAVLDLSPSGRQPMLSPDGRLVIVYNGEVYNWRELRTHLESRGIVFRSTCDTEVLIAGIQVWGLEGALRRINGMFAFALWDRATRTVTLARDRLGEKPLYYAMTASQLVFASELAALRLHPDVGGDIDPNGLGALMLYNSIPAPLSILQGVSKLPPGCVLTWPGSSARGASTPKRYWSLAEVVSDRPPPPLRSDAAAIDELEELLLDSVRLRMVSDVPVGAFLSGGTDSSTIVALMQQLSDRPLRTFSIGSPNPDFDEATHAAKVAAHLGTDHTTVRLTAEDALAIARTLAQTYSEPFADSSQIPTCMVSALARRSVTVCLSGDGGDELFGGYNRHRWLPIIWRRTRWIPDALLHATGSAIAAIPPSIWRAGAQIVPEGHRPRSPEIKARKLGRMLDARNPAAMYDQLTWHWNVSSDIVRPAHTVPMAALPLLPWGTDIALAAMASDAARYLPDDILVKLDRATMSVGLEARVPMLDPRVVAFAFALPSEMRARSRRSKWLLRQVLARHVPEVLTARPKTGFSVPIGAWLRGPMRGWAEDLLTAETVRRQGYLKAAAIQTAWKAHLSGREDRSQELWCVLMFQSWLEGQGKDQ